jgi:hypothetical protein
MSTGIIGILGIKTKDVFAFGAPCQEVVSFDKMRKEMLTKSRVPVGQSHRGRGG